eukprot:gene6665-4427_t
MVMEELTPMETYIRTQLYLVERTPLAIQDFAVAVQLFISYQFAALNSDREHFISSDPEQFSCRYVFSTDLKFGNLAYSEKPSAIKFIDLDSLVVASSIKGLPAPAYASNTSHNLSTFTGMNSRMTDYDPRNFPETVCELKHLTSLSAISDAWRESEVGSSIPEHKQLYDLMGTYETAIITAVCSLQLVEAIGYMLKPGGAAYEEFKKGDQERFIMNLCFNKPVGPPTDRLELVRGKYTEVQAADFIKRWPDYFDVCLTGIAELLDLAGIARTEILRKTNNLGGTPEEIKAAEMSFGSFSPPQFIDHAQDGCTGYQATVHVAPRDPYTDFPMASNGGSKGGKREFSPDSSDQFYAKLFDTKVAKIMAGEGGGASVAAPEAAPPWQYGIPGSRRETVYELITELSQIWDSGTARLFAGVAPAGGSCTVFCSSKLTKMVPVTQKAQRACIEAIHAQVGPCAFRIFNANSEYALSEWTSKHADCNNILANLIYVATSRTAVPDAVQKSLRKGLP